MKNRMTTDRLVENPTDSKNDAPEVNVVEPTVHICTLLADKFRQNDGVLLFVQYIEMRRGLPAVEHAVHCWILAEG
jgi:hypothetical protein